MTNNAHPVIDSNLRHDISASYDINERFQVRAGVSNITDEMPSYPTPAAETASSAGPTSWGWKARY